MNLAEFRSLLSPAGQDALHTAEAFEPREEDYLRCFQELCRSMPAELARPALEIAIQRRLARVKYPFADQLYFTREALEQASAWDVATYRAGRLSGYNRLLDLGCSVGADTLALAQSTPEPAPVFAADLDPLRLAMAQANLAARGQEQRAHFLNLDLRDPLPLKRLDRAAAFFDPARRRGGRRIHSVNDYQPPLETALDWLADIPALAIKVSPGVDLAQLEPYDAEVEFISLSGELKEATLWFGSLKTISRRATLLPGGHTLTGDAGRSPTLPVCEPAAWIYEPDPAVLRAGLVTELGMQLSAAQLDPDIAYLTGEQAVQTPFARCWAIEAWLPFSLKSLRLYLRAQGVGRVTIKKRGSPLQPESLIRDLRLQGDQERVVFLTHLRGRPIAVVAFPNM
jgi:hypothetical protein